MGVGFQISNKKKQIFISSNFVQFHENTDLGSEWAEQFKTFLTNAPPAYNAESVFTGAEAVGIGVGMILKSHASLVNLVSTVADQNQKLHKELEAFKKVCDIYSGILYVLFQGITLLLPL